jgi:hypothetical protein
VRFLCTPADTNGFVAVLRTTRRLHTDGTKRQSAPDGLMGRPAYPRRLTVNFQVTVLKVLVSYPDGFASLSDLKRDVAILANQRTGVVGTHHQAGSTHARARNLRTKPGRTARRWLADYREGAVRAGTNGGAIRSRSACANCCTGFAGVDGTASSFGRHGSRPPSSAAAKASPSL